MQNKRYGEHTSIPCVLVDYWHRTSQTVHLADHAGIRQLLVVRRNPLSWVGRSLPARRLAGSRSEVVESSRSRVAGADKRRTAVAGRHLDLDIGHP